MAETAAHVTMLQRSPTYVVSVPGKDASPIVSDNHAGDMGLPAQPLEKRPLHDVHLPALAALS